MPSDRFPAFPARSGPNSPSVELASSICRPLSPWPCRTKFVGLGDRPTPWAPIFRPTSMVFQVFLSTILALQIGPETILRVEGFLMVVEWNLVYFCVKICSLGGISTSGIFDIFACISTTKGARNKWRPQRDSAHQTGSETPWVASLIVGW
jgi:hypothetical protein